MGEPQKIDIEQLLIWTYQRQRADVVIEGTGDLHDLERVAGGGVVFGRTTDGCASQISTLGVRVDGGGGVSVALHPDAETVHEAVKRANRVRQGLLTSYAKGGNRPEWYPGVRVERRAALGPKGTPIRVYDDNRHVIGIRMREVGVRDVVGDDGELREEQICGGETLAVARFVYGQWRAALCWLAGELQAPGRLKRHQVVGPGVPEKPWEEKIPLARSAKMV